MDWYLEVLRQYAVFNGRARRKEYWFFTLCSLLTMLVFSVLDSTPGSNQYGPDPKGMNGQVTA